MENWQLWGSFLLIIKIEQKRKLDNFFKEEITLKHLTTLGIKESRFMTSSSQGPLEPDSKNTDQLIKTTVVNLLSWNFQDWLTIIKYPICESLKLIRLAERILVNKTWKIVLVCTTHKNDAFKLKLCQMVDLITLYKCVNILPVLDLELLMKIDFMTSFSSGL